jgi:hypothetical protein
VEAINVPSAPVSGHDLLTPSLNFVGGNGDRVAGSRAMQLVENARKVIVELQHDRASLYNVITVNRAWFAIGVEVLWRAPLSNALNTIAPERHLFYAKNTQTITRLNWTDLYLGLDMPRLRTLHQYDQAHQFLVPSVTHLDCAFSMGVLHRLISQRPRLQKLALKFVTGLQGFETLVQVIEQLPSPALSSVRLLGSSCGGQASVDALFKHLAHRDG